jgi:hypothetical protein
MYKQPHSNLGNLDLDVKMSRDKIGKVTFDKCTMPARKGLPWLDISYKGKNSDEHIISVDTDTGYAFRCIGYGDSISRSTSYAANYVSDTVYGIYDWSSKKIYGSDEDEDDKLVTIVDLFEDAKGPLLKRLWKQDKRGYFTAQ